jgi:hypothetical protein
VTRKPSTVRRQRRLVVSNRLQNPATHAAVSAAAVETLEQRRLLCTGSNCQDTSIAAHADNTPTNVADAMANPTVHELAAPPRLTAAAKKKPANAGITTQSLFQPMDSIPVKANEQAYIKPIAYAPFGIAAASMRATLANAPLEFTNAAKTSPLVLSLPTPTGGFARFKVVEAQMMQPALAKKYPSIKTYRGQGIDDPTATLAMDFTLQGFHAQVLSPNGAFYIDPYYHLDQSSYISYYKRDLFEQQTFKDLTVADPIRDDEHGAGGDNTLETTSGTELRTYRATVGATGEYTAFHGGTVPLGLSAVTTAINRISAVYEVDFAVRMVLVANEDLLIYTNPATDPFTAPSNASTSNSQNQTNTDAVIGNANYDFGHVFYRGSDNGLAGAIGNVGVTGQKAKGYSSHSNPVGDPFTIDYVAHEMGHQFGGRHDFNNCGGSQGDSSALAVEPGSGNTIMAYAGICGAATDLQPHSDPYFHSINYDQITAYTTSGTGYNVAVKTPTGNTPPTINAGSNYTIPARTPFALTATGSDPDGDTLTYAWEQRNGGSPVAVGVDNGVGPIVRPWNPTTDPTRTFPRLSNLLNNTVPFGETLPTTTRTLNFTVMVRDNRAGGGGANTANMVVSVINTGAPFQVTGPNTAVTWDGGSTQTVTWDVAGTNSGSINAANVAILLSTDGGNTFNTVLASSTANDGSESITVPQINTTLARIKVLALGNVFFDLSNANFTIQQTVQPNGVWTGNGDGVHWSDPANWTNNTVPGASEDASINVAANPTIIVDGTQSVHSVTSSEALDISGSLSVATASTFNGAVTLAGTLDGAGAATFNAALTWASGGSMTGAGASIIAAGGTMSLTGAGASLSSRPMTLAGNGSLAAGGDKVLVLSGGLTLAGTGTLDLADNDMIVDYDRTSVLGGIQSAINSARTGGAWNGNGLTSSSAGSNAQHNTTLGAIESADYRSMYGTSATFDGQSLDDSMVLVKYTYYGDTDFNGAVNFDDYVHTDSGFNNGRTGWTNGDFDGNGVVNFDDYVLIDLAFNTQGAVL